MNTIAWVVAVASLILGGLISWLITRFYSRKYANTRRKLLFIREALQLMPNNPKVASELKVTYGRKPVIDPYLLKVTLRNLGPTDLGANHFEDGAIRVTFPGGYVALLDTDIGEAKMLAIGEDLIEFPPQLLELNGEIKLELLTDGLVIPLVHARLRDTDVVKARYDQAKYDREMEYYMQQPKDPKDPLARSLTPFPDPLIIEKD